jgi:hypothetical protein
MEQMLPGGGGQQRALPYVRPPAGPAPGGMEQMRLPQTQAGAAQQVASMVRQNPPSQGGGWNKRDLAVLDTIDQIYRSPHRADQYGRMSSDQRAFLAGGAKKAGHSQATFEEQWRRSRAGQGSVLA